MMNKEDIKKIIHESIEDINLIIDEPIIWKEEETIIFDDGSSLDSVNLVSLLLGIEQLINEKYDVEISIVNEEIFKLNYNPLKNVGRLIDYTINLIDKCKT